MCVCVCVCVCVLSHSVVSNSAMPSTVAHQVLLSMEFSRQEYWSELPFPPPGDLSHPGIEPPHPLLCFLHWQVDYLPLSHLGSPQRLNRPVLLYISLTDHCEILSFCNRKCKKENILVLLSMKMQTSLRMWIHIKSLFVSL